MFTTSIVKGGIPSHFDTMGDNQFEQYDVGNWTDITQVAAGGNHTVGLKADGTVVAVVCTF